ncbi:Uncharacterised protein [Mycobacteroides abscessus subsp. abscessus]|nr:Uncharacterised protein [Mycobacteroides abscessus subsp. abscessus]
MVDARLFESAFEAGPAVGDGAPFGLGGGDALLEVLGFGAAEFEGGPAGEVVVVDGGVVVAFGAIGGNLEFDEVAAAGAQLGAQDVELAALLERQEGVVEGDGLGFGLVGRVVACRGVAQLEEVVALATKFDDVVVGVLEVTEFAHRRVGEGEGVGDLEHVVAEESVEAVEALRRLRLVEQLEGGIAGHAEDLAHPGVELRVHAVRGDDRLGVIGLESAGLESGARVLLEVGEVEAGAFEQAHVGEVGRGRARSLEEEEPGQGERTVGAVVVAQHDAAPRGTGPQVLAHHSVLVGVRGPRPGPADVADEAALVDAAAGGLGGDVEAQPLVGGEDGGDAVEEGGLPGAGGSSDEMAAVGDGDPVDVGVEGAPVRDLDLREPPLAADVGPVRPAGAGLVGDEGGVEREEGLGHASTFPWATFVAGSPVPAFRVSATASAGSSVSVSAVPASPVPAMRS